MIFLTLGTQKFQFNRLLEKVDELKGLNKINEDIFAQVGYSDYQPQNFTARRFLDKIEYQKKVTEADLIITHGGVGSILSASKNDTPVIVIPRLKKYGEHVDDHQLDIVKVFNDLGVIIACDDLNNLQNEIKKAKTFKFQKYKKNNRNFINGFSKIVSEI